MGRLPDGTRTGPAEREPAVASRRRPGNALFMDDTRCFVQASNGGFGRWREAATLPKRWVGVNQNLELIDTGRLSNATGRPVALDTVPFHHWWNVRDKEGSCAISSQCRWR